MTETFKIDTIVQHTTAFLRATSWYTGVPIDGKVVPAPEGQGTLSGCVWVEWCDGHIAQINAKNLKVPGTWEPN